MPCFIWEQQSSVDTVLKLTQSVPCFIWEQESTVATLPQTNTFCAMFHLGSSVFLKLTHSVLCLIWEQLPFLKLTYSYKSVLCLIWKQLSTVATFLYTVK